MANLYTQFQNELKSRSIKGMTNRELALQANTSQPHINRLLNGDAEQLAKLKVETFLELFPRVKELLMSHADDLTSETSAASVANISSPHAVAAGGNVEVHQDGGESSEKLERLAAFVLASSLSDEEKVAAMKLLH